MAQLFTSRSPLPHSLWHSGTGLQSQNSGRQEQGLFLDLVPKIYFTLSEGFLKATKVSRGDGSSSPELVSMELELLGICYLLFVIICYLEISCHGGGSIYLPTSFSIRKTICWEP